MKTPKIILTLLALLFTQKGWAQPEMADGMRAEGKIYVVVAIILIVLIGMIVYLFMLDRKLKKLENEFREKRPN